MHYSGQPIRRGTIHQTHEPHSIYSVLSPFHLHSDLRDSHLFLRILTTCGITFAIMTLEEVIVQKPTERAPCTGKALEEVLETAKANDCLTIGVYESAKVMNL